MPREFLAGDAVIATRSLEEARDAVTRVYLPHELVGPQDAIDMRLNATSDRFLTLGYLTYQAETELRMPAAEQWYHINLQLTGATWASRSDGTSETMRGVSVLSSCRCATPSASTSATTGFIGPPCGHAPCAARARTPPAGTRT